MAAMKGSSWGERAGRAQCLLELSPRKGSPSGRSHPHGCCSQILCFWP